MWLFSWPNRVIADILDSYHLATITERNFEPRVVYTYEKGTYPIPKLDLTKNVLVVTSLNPSLEIPIKSYLTAMNLAVDMHLTTPLPVMM